MNERNAHRLNARPSRKGRTRLQRVLLIGALTLCASIPAYANQIGQASWYGPGFHGRKTASGQTFNQHALTAAHRQLPLGTRARVTNLNNGKKVEVTINDRGPYVGGRVIDLSRAAARRLAINGLGRVRIEALP